MTQQASTPDALIERLRARTAGPKCNADGTYTVGNCPPDALCREAAAEIERLRDELNLCCALKLEYQQQAAGGIERLCAEIERLRADAARYRWLRDLRCNSVSVSRDDDHACNYMTASEWIDNNADWYVDDNPEEVQRMRDTNTIWRLQVYPNTPVGFNVWNGSTLDSAIDAAMRDAL